MFYFGGKVKAYVLNNTSNSLGTVWMTLFDL